MSCRSSESGHWQTDPHLIVSLRLFTLNVPLGNDVVKENIGHLSAGVMAVNRHLKPDLECPRLSDLGSDALQWHAGHEQGMISSPYLP